MGGNEGVGKMYVGGGLGSDKRVIECHSSDGIRVQVYEMNGRKTKVLP